MKLFCMFCEAMHKTRHGTMSRKTFRSVGLIALFFLTAVTHKQFKAKAKIENRCEEKSIE